MSLMRAHQAAMAARGTKVLGSMPAATVASIAPPLAAPSGSGLMAAKQLADFCNASLETDLHSLKGIASFERKIQCKRENLIPKYREYVHRLQAAGLKHDLIAYFMVWCFDAGLIEEALTLGLYCIEHEQPLPERFNSRVPFFVATNVLEWAEGEFRDEREFEPYFGTVFCAMLEEPEAWDISDKITAGYNRLAGLQAEKIGDLTAAKIYLQRATELGAQVKTRLDEVCKKLAKQEDKNAQEPKKTDANAK